MQQEQVQKRSFKNNPDLRVQFALEIAKIYNKYLPDNMKYDLNEVEEHAKNELYYQKYEQAIQINKNANKTQDLEKDLKKECLAPEKQELQGFYGLNRLLNNKLSLDENKKEENEEIIKKANTPEGYTEITADYVKSILEFDYTKCFVTTIEEAIENYANNVDICSAAFCSKTLLSSSNFVTNYKIDKLYQDNKGLFERATDNKQIANLACNPFYFLLPHKDFDNEIWNILENKSPDNDTSSLYQEFNDVEELSWGGHTCTNMLKYNADKKFASRFLKNNRKVKEYIDSGKLDKNFPLEKTFTYKGKPIKAADAFDKIEAGEKVDVKEYTPKQKQEIKEALNENLAINSNDVINTLSSMFQSYRDESTSLNNTKAMFTRDSKVFKNLTKELKKFAKDYDSFITKIDIVKDGSVVTSSHYNQFFNEHKDQLEKIEQYNNEYVIYKKNQKEQYVAKNKQLNERSLNRLTICENASNEKRLANLKELITKKPISQEVVQDENRKSIIVKDTNDLNLQTDLSKKVEINENNLKLVNNKVKE